MPHSKETPAHPLLLQCGLGDCTSMANFPGVRMVQALTLHEAIDILKSDTVAVLMVGPEFCPQDQVYLIEAATNINPRSVNVAFTSEPDTSFYQHLVDDDFVFYVAKVPLPAESLLAIMRASVRKARERGDETQVGLFGKAEEADFLLRLHMQQTPAEICALVTETVRIRARGQRSRFLLYDIEKDVLLTHHLQSAEAPIYSGESAAAGLVGYALRTGEGVVLPRAGYDSRYDSGSDDPGGSADARLIVEPVFRRGDWPLGVITVARDGSEPEFEYDARSSVLSIAAAAASRLEELAVRDLVGEQLVGRGRGMSKDVFLTSAVNYYAGNELLPGSLVQTLPRWLGASNWFNLVILCVVGLFLVAGRVNDYAAGPAVVRSRDRTTLVAPVSGLVRGTEVAAGDRVRAGDLLIRLEESPGASSLDRFRGQLRAPYDGVIGDLHVQAGQQLQAGQHVATLMDEGAGFEVTAFLPGSAAPQLRPGTILIVRLDGYPDAYETAKVRTTGQEILSPSEIARFTAGAVAVDGPVVRVQCLLESATFLANDRHYAYHDGMTAKTEVSLDTSPVLFVLVPALKPLRHYFGW